MENIYDNGESLLGEVYKIKQYTNDMIKQYQENEDFENVEYYKGVLSDISSFEDDTIIVIHYENDMYYTIESWTSKNIIKNF